MPLQPQSSGLKVGLFGIGLDAYWPQFAGLEKRLQGYVERVAEKLGASGCEVVNLGLIDAPEKAVVAGHDFRRADVDLVFLYVTTYALSSTVLPVLRRAKVPVVVLNLAPTASTTVAMAVGDALAVSLLEKRDFRHDDFAALHLPFRYLYREALRSGDSWLWTSAYHSGFYVHGDTIVPHAAFVAAAILSRSPALFARNVMLRSVVLSALCSDRTWWSVPVALR